MSYCRLCGEPTETITSEFCPECMEEYEYILVNPIEKKIGEKAESVLASFFEGFAEDEDGQCLYCAGTHCDKCEMYLSEIIAESVEYIGCDTTVLEDMTCQYFKW